MDCLRVFPQGHGADLDCLAGSQPQKGILTYSLSPNRQNPFAHAAHAAIFNTWRRFSAQVLYFAPPLVIAYVTMNWAVERFVKLLTENEFRTDIIIRRNEYLNSKAGRLEFGEE